MDNILGVILLVIIIALAVLWIIEYLGYRKFVSAVHTFNQAVDNLKEVGVVINNQGDTIKELVDTHNDVAEAVNLVQVYLTLHGKALQIALGIEGLIPSIKAQRQVETKDE